MCYVLRDKKGTSFVEIILYVAIVGMLITSFISFSLYIHKAYNKSFSISEVHTNIRFALNIFSQRIKGATSINVADSVFESDPGILSLNMDNPTIDPIVFNLNQDNGILYMSEGFSYPMAVTDDTIAISKLIFNYLEEYSQEGIIIDAVFDYPGASQGFQYSQAVYTAVTPRN